MTNTAKALDEAADLLLRFSAAVDSGLLAKMRAQRRNGHFGAKRDLLRIADLTRSIYESADQLVSIAEAWEREDRERMGA